MESADDDQLGLPDDTDDLLADAFADNNDFYYEENHENDSRLQNSRYAPPESRAGRRRDLPWQRAAVFQGVDCANQALAALSDHAGDQWFQQKGVSGNNLKADKVRDGFPSAQSARVNKDGTSTLEVKCPFSWVSNATA